MIDLRKRIEEVKRELVKKFSDNVEDNVNFVNMYARIVYLRLANVSYDHINVENPSDEVKDGICKLIAAAELREGCYPLDKRNKAYRIILGRNSLLNETNVNTFVNAEEDHREDWDGKYRDSPREEPMDKYGYTLKDLKRRQIAVERFVLNPYNTDNPRCIRDEVPIRIREIKPSLN